ncbi:MAG: O-antigen ligase family protein, partial [Pseudomonadota bacterium]
MISSRTSDVSPIGRLLTIRRRRFDLLAIEPFVTRMAIFFCMMPLFRPVEELLTWSDLIFCISAVLLLLSGRMRLSPLGPATVPWLSAFALFAVGMLVSSLLGYEPIRAVIVLGQYFFAYILLAYILVRTVEAMVDRFIKAFVVGTVSLSAYGLAVYWSGTDVDFEYVTGSGRLGSLMGNPNANANIIGLTVPFVLYLWYSKKLGTLLVGATLAILGTALVATSSVGGLLWTSTGIAVFVALTVNWRVLVGAVICLAVAIPLAAKYGESVLPKTFQTRVLGAAQSGDMGQAGTFSYRMGLIHEAMDMADETMLLGIGADQFRVKSVSGQPVHNAYLLIWTEGGLPSLIGWLMLPQIVILSAFWVYVRPGGRIPAATAL